MTPAIIEMHNISKNFPGVQANRSINLRLLPGEIHALLGENGAGKTTLMSILAGMYRPDSGEILLRGQAVSFSSPQDAINHGIGMIYQHFMLVPRLTVAENVILGYRKQAFYLSKKRLLDEVKKTIDHYGFNLDPGQKVGTLSLGEQQRVEILRALYRQSDVLILDEPTAILSPLETHELFTILRRMADEGKAVILITHKLNEVMAAADRVTVLHRGELVDSLPIAEVDSRTLTHLMIGHDVQTNPSHPLHQSASVILQVRNLQVQGDRGERVVNRVNLNLRKGEMLAIAGVSGNGQEELLQALAGLRPVTGGQVFLQETDITNMPVRDLLQKGVRMIPEDRLRTGLVGNLNVIDNIVLRDYYKEEYGRLGLLNFKKTRSTAQNLLERFQVLTSDLDNPVRLLSGGNLQRLMLARELLSQPELLLAVYPSRGLDVGAAQNVYALMDEARKQGTAILTVMEDLEEILQVADRVAVMYNGLLSPLLPIGEVSPGHLGELMAGIGWPRTA